MRTAYFVTFTLLVASAGMMVALDRSPSNSHETVIVSSGTLRLKAFLWKPAGSGPFPAVLFNHGAGGTDAAHTGGFVITAAARFLGEHIR